MGQLWSSILYALAGALVGAAITFFLTKRKFEKDLRENPPINEKMIRAMFLQMGRKPSEAQIRQIMKTVNSQKNKK
ncbi:MAG: YneF family protein [Erysipelotrichaceae bacterium]|nr:YneF family protein [Erysipelotrichaceae bacterium]